MNKQIIKFLTKHGVESIEQDGQIFALSVAVVCDTGKIESEWIIVDKYTVREFLGY